MTVVEKVYSARKFLRKTTKELRSILTGEFTVKFDDGELKRMTAHEVVISSHFWDLHREIPWLPLNSSHSIVSAMKGSSLNSSTHTRLFEKIFWDIMDEAMEKKIAISPDHVDRINEFIYRKSNEIYNFTCTDLQQFTTGVDIEDYYEIIYYPPFKKILAEMGPADEDIKKAYALATEIIMKDPYLARNAIAIAARSGVIKLNQLLQVVVARGNVTDIDSMIFPEPALGNFIQGYKNWYSLLIDTRTASKSLFFSAQLLRDSEYNSRKLQFLCQTVETVYPGDCKTTKRLQIKIKPDVLNPDGSVKQKGDLGRYAGKYFDDPETGELRELKPSDTKYIGQVLKFRSFLSGCAHPDPHGVCATCFGAAAAVLSPGTNIGWSLAAALMQILNQSILAVKHIDSSSSSNAIVLGQHSAKYLAVGEGGNCYRFHNNLKKKKISLEISEDQFTNVATVLGITDFETISPVQLSELTMVKLTVASLTSMDDETVPLDLTYEKRNSFFTVKALEYIKNKGYTRLANGNFVFDFTDWDLAEPFAELPARHFNNADHAKDIAALIQGRNSNKFDRQKRKQEGSVIEYYHDIYNLINSRLDVPAVIVELFTYGASIRSSKDNDYRLPKDGTPKEMGLSSSTIPFRSMGAAMGFEYVTRELFTNTLGYDPAKTSSHILDVFVLPHEVVNDFERRCKKFGRQTGRATA